MRILGIDYGEKRIGLAISDPLGITAQGMPTLLRRDLAADLKALVDLIKEREVVEVVIGLPKNMDNTLGKKAMEVLEFVNLLKTYISIPVYTFDERLSTMRGNRALLEGNMSRKKRRDKIDMVSAQLILQGYLDGRKGSQDVTT